MKKVFMWIGILAVLAIGGCAIVTIGVLNSADKAINETTPSTKVEVEKVKTDKVKTKEDESKLTMQKFKKLKTDMSYDKVVKILGSEGTVLSESEVGGIKTVMYQWDGSFGANMNATFQNDKMLSKAQFGLK